MTIIENLILPEHLKHMNILSIAQSPVIEGLCIVFLGEHLSGEGGLPTIRLHLGKLNSLSNLYEIEKELEAFSFITVEAALIFLEQLPNMSALELILAMSEGVSNSQRDCEVYDNQ